MGKRAAFCTLIADTFAGVKQLAPAGTAMPQCSSINLQSDCVRYRGTALRPTARCLPSTWSVMAEQCGTAFHPKAAIFAVGPKA